VAAFIVFAQILLFIYLAFVSVEFKIWQHYTPRSVSVKFIGD